MAQQITENEARNEFLKLIEYEINLNSASKDWKIKTDQQNAHMALIIESSKRFPQNYIEFIIETVCDKEIFKFDLLRKYGWCSCHCIVQSSPGYLELGWMNLRSIRKPFEPPDSDIIGEVCNCQICQYRFED